MSKKMLLLALSAFSTALFVFPAAASATPNHLDTIPPNGFTIHGPEGNWSTTSGSTFKCTTTTGTGSLTSTTTGTLTLTFDHCFTTVLGTTVTCTSHNPAELAGSGNISWTLNAVFHLIAIDAPHAGNGILVTPPAGSTQVAHFTCAGIQTTVEGTGIIGTITSPACNVASNTAKFLFQRNAAIQHGHQTHLKWTGVTYDLTTGGSTAALEQQVTITFNNGATPKLICT